MVKGFIVEPGYLIEDDKNYIQLFGRLENKDSFIANIPFKPYFYIRTSDKPLAQEILDQDDNDAELKDTDMKNFSGEPVTKASFNIPKDMTKYRKIFIDNAIICFETNLNFPTRFLIDKDIHGSIEISGEYEKGELVNRIYKEAKIEPTDYFPKLKILSIDIETNMHTNEIFCISLYSDNFKKVLIHSKEKHNHSTSYESEKEMLEGFSEHIKKLDPDIIVGWNVIDFDFVVLRDRYKKHKVPFKLGRNERECKLDISESFFISSKAKFPGRMILDGIALLKDSFISMPDNKLNTVASVVLGKEKLITSDDKGQEIIDLYKNNKQELIDYNLEDSKLVLEILNKLKLLDLTILRSILTRMQLDRVGASIASFDSLYIKELQKTKIVAPSIISSGEEERITGGFVMESKPGIYNNILVFDFKSLYPSIIKTFNIDPVSYVPFTKVDSYKEGELVKAPNNAHFINTDGILPKLITKLWKQRDKAKKEKDMIASNAIKITMNSMFGVLANPTCRFYNRDIANAITFFGQELIKLTAEKIKEKGHEIIYGDTDSIFVKVKDLKYEDTKKFGDELSREINDFYEKYIQKTYNRKNALELEFEKVYKKFFMPQVRGGGMGAKKRYAGTLEKPPKSNSFEISFVGLEYVRSDWTQAAKDFQKGLLERVFDEKPIDEFIKQQISDLESGKFDDKLVYKKSIRKPVSSYVKTTPPHIQAARKIGKKGTGAIKYVITVDGPEAEGHVHHKIDYKHYIDKQIKPIADGILLFTENSFTDILKGKQKSLFDF